MSRDGFVQKSMLTSLAVANRLTLDHLTTFAFGGKEPSVNQRRSGRAALKRLLERGEVVQSPWRNEKGDRCFSLPGGARCAQPNASTFPMTAYISRTRETRRHTPGAISIRDFRKWGWHRLLATIR